LIFKKLLKRYIKEYKDWQIAALIYLSKKIGNVMNAEKLYYATPDNSRHERAASVNTMSFW
jgi:hypothetical protein